ncbi:MAG: hypothetical protein JSW59_17490 [Phycisphaerales bacterium]|nr:MAG: hypothetical protein JSW59_17490 [Phycisphaerales bacterium]
MLDVKEKILEAYAGTEKLRHVLAANATDEYFVALDASNSLDQAQLDIARAAARSVLKKELLSPARISAISCGTVTDERSAAAIALIFDSVAKPLRIPEPAMHAGTRAFGLALSAMIGAIVGMVILTPLFRLAFEMGDVGLALGGPFGALCAVLIVHRIGRSRLLRRLLGRRRPIRYDRQNHEEVVRTSIEQWLNLTVPLLAMLCICKSQPQAGPADQESAFRRIGGLIYTLHRAAPESLSVAADELIQEARNCGFEGLEGAPAFLSAAADEQSVIEWTNDLLTKYETFGDVAEGDKVRIERKPVVFDGNVMERGLVRKLRDK